MIDLTTLELHMKALNFDVNPKELYEKIKLFSDFLENIPIELERRIRLFLNDLLSDGSFFISDHEEINAIGKVIQIKLSIGGTHKFK